MAAEALRESPGPRAAALPPRRTVPQPPDRLPGNLPWAPRHCGARPLPAASPAAFSLGLGASSDTGLPGSPRCAHGGGRGSGRRLGAAPAAPAGGAGWAVAPGGLRPAPPACCSLLPARRSARPVGGAGLQGCFAWKWRLLAAAHGDGGLGPCPFVPGSREASPGFPVGAWPGLT